MDVRRVFSGLNIIAVGLILLANSLGYLPWNVWWNILSLWPLLLVAAGLDVLGRAFDREWMRALSGIVVLGGLAFGALVMPASGVAMPGVFTLGPVEGIPYEQTLPSRVAGGEATLKLTEGASEIRIGSSESDLVALSGRSSRPVPTIESADSGELTAVTVARPPGSGPALGGSTMNVALSRLALWRGITLETGASSLEADLARLRLSALAIKAGAASVTATLGPLTDCVVDVSAGASSIAINVPSTARVAVISDTALVGADLPGFKRTYGVGLGHTTWTYSPTGHAVDANITIKVSMGAGSLSVKTYPTTITFAPSGGGTESSSTLF